MAAIITETFRRNSSKLLLSDISNSANSYYVGIGKSDDWYEDLAVGATAPFPIGTFGDTQNALHALTNLIKVSAPSVNTVIPRVFARPGEKYKIYNTYDPSCLYPSGDINPCYIVLESGIYLCIGKETLNSTFTLPVDFGIGKGYEPFLADGYTWVFLGEYDIYHPINTEQFIKVSTSHVVDTGVLAEIKTETGGLVYGFHVLNGGLYANTVGDNPNIMLTINGSDENGDPKEPTTIGPLPCTTSQVLIGSTVYRKLNVISNLLISQFVSGYKSASVLVDVYENSIVSPPIEPAVVAAMIAPPLGFAENPSGVLPAWYIGISINTNAATPDVYSKYSQISLIKNPLGEDGELLTPSAINTLKSFSFTPIGGVPYDLSNIEVGFIITQTIGNVTYNIGTIDSINYETGVIYYIQNVKTGYSTLSSSYAVKFTMPNGSIINSDPYITTAINNSIYAHGTGECVFLENRSPITRSEDQNEELKIIIQL
jgi:hypothetical protein